MKKILSNLKKFWSQLPTSGKIIWTIIFTVFIFPHLFIFIMYHTVYGAPWQKYFDVSERQILSIKEDKLYLTNFYLCNSKSYQTFSNSIKNNYGSNMCGEEILILENVKADKGSPQEDYYLPKNFSTAILPGNKIVWAYNDDATNYEINLSEVVKDENNNYQIKTKSLLKLEKFDLGTFADNLKKGKPVQSLSTIQKLTGHIWTKPFLVEDNAIVFYDATITKVDNEKPVEAMSRKWKVFVDGTYVVENGERERIDIEYYNLIFIENKVLNTNRNMTWNYFKNDINFLQKKKESEFYPFNQYINSADFLFYSPNLQINRNYTSYIDGTLCDTFMLNFPCTQWKQSTLQINSIKFDKEYVFKTGTILYFNLDNFRGNHTPIHGINNLRAVSQNDEVVSFYSGYGSYVYLMDLKTGGKVKLGTSELQIIYIK